MRKPCSSNVHSLSVLDTQNKLVELIVNFSILEVPRLSSIVLADGSGMGLAYIRVHAEMITYEFLKRLRVVAHRL